MTELRFPDGFLWGSAAAGHQVEGGNVHSDWWRFEAAGKIHDGTVSGRAVDYWNRFEEDHRLMRELGMGVFRLGVEWARVEPAPAEFDASALEHYRDILRSLRDHGLQVSLTLNHWVLPAWFADLGGWESPQAVVYFERYARRVVTALGPLVDQWVTLNEPMVPVLLGNALGMFPPEKKNLRSASRVFRTLLAAHAAGARIIRELAPTAPDGTPASVGVAMAYPWHEALGRRAALAPIERAMASFFNRTVWGAWDASLASGRAAPPWGQGQRVPGLADSVDFCGVNYYFRQSMTPFDVVQHDGSLRVGPVPEGVETTEMGWQIHPQSFTEALLAVWRRFGKPIFITENGISDRSDTQRPAYLLRHLAALHRALMHGVDVRGYYHWTFIDNFEWAEGFAPRFGLVACDHDDPALQRRPRESARLYAAIVARNGITREMVRDFCPRWEAEVFSG